jgi:hypothetical protein
MRRPAALARWPKWVRDRRGRVANPVERVEAVEQAHERGQHQPFGRRAEPQQRHQGQQIEAAFLGAGDQRGQQIRAGGHVGVEEQQPRAARAPGCLPAGPRLTGPACGRRRAGDDLQAGDAAGVGRHHPGGVVGRAVVHDDQLEASVGLPRQPVEAGADASGFVTRRDQRRDQRPIGGRLSMYPQPRLPALARKILRAPEGDEHA